MKKFFIRKKEGISGTHKGVLPVRASLTIEAALSVPIFLFFVIAVSYFLIMISLQTDIQFSMEETGRSIGKAAYLAEHTSGNSGEGAKGDTAGLLSAGINSLTIKTWMMKDGLGERINRSAIRGGTAGFYVYHSGYDRKQGILDIVVNYTYEIPFLPESIGRIRFAQRSRSHVWTGTRLRNSKLANGEGNGKEEGQKVYVTPHGTAYHLSRECHYLDLSVQGVSASSVDALRNKNGGKYYMCPDCARSGESYQTVYITSYGTNWHSDLHCSGLKRTVEEVELSDVGNRHLCPMCGGSH